MGYTVQWKATHPLLQSRNREQPKIQYKLSNTMAVIEPGRLIRPSYLKPRPGCLSILRKVWWSEMDRVKGLIADARAEEQTQVPLGLLFTYKLLSPQASAAGDVFPPCVPLEPPWVSAQPSVISHHMLMQ